MNITSTPRFFTTKFSNIIQDRMKLCGYRPHTIKAYLGQVQGFLRFSRPLDLHRTTNKDVRDYLNHLVDKGLSRSTIDQATKSLEILYYEILRKRLDFSDFKRPRKDRPTPVVLTSDEINKITASTKNHGHRLMIDLAYSAGLRVSELVEVKVKNLNLDKLTLFVPGHGRKNRTTTFSEHLKNMLAKQVEARDADQYLFPSKRGGMLTTRAVAKFFKKALIISGLKKMATPNSLRQSFANTMLDQGTDPVILQSILGQRTLTNFTSDSKKAA